ncbi:MAG: MFS transporter [Myxococcota bacterium]
MRVRERSAASSPPHPPPRDAPQRSRPRWMLFAPFLGRPPELTPRQWRVLGLVSLATLFGQYDGAIFALALPQIQAGLAIHEVDVGLLGSIVRMGSLPAFGVALAADRVGRRRILLLSILASALLTGATALAPGARSFAALQFFAHLFTAAELLLSVVVIAEELDADARGWGIGALFAIQACGAGVAALLFPLSEALGLGWRALYGFGLAPLVLIAGWRRALPETESYERQQSERKRLGHSEYALAPMLHLARDYPRRFGVVAAAILIGAAAGAAADFLGPKYLQDAHGWAPGQVALLYLGGGAFGIFGSAYAGRLSDRIGRKPVAVGLGVGVTLLSVGFYNVGGWVLVPLWIGMIFVTMGSGAVSSTFTAELFPTSHRSTATGALGVVATLGGSLGLALESVLYGMTGSHWTAVTILLGATLLTPLIVAVAFPETAGRTLEEISPERGRGDPALESPPREESPSHSAPS